MKTLLLCGLIAVSFAAFSQKQMFEVCPLKTGMKTPEKINLTNINNQAVKLDSLINTKPTVLVFFRGGWCPFCTAHLGELQQVKSKIDSLGYQLIAITPDRFSNLDSSYKSSKAEFTLLSDHQAKAIQAFGLAWKIDDPTYLKYKNSYGMDTEFWSGEKHHLLPVPAVYVIKNGTVQFNFVNPNYTSRLSGKTLTAVLSTL